MIYADFYYEEKLWESGFQRVAGIDEVGRGSWAGPVVAAAVIFPPFIKTEFLLADSKLLKPKERVELAEKIKETALSIGIAEVGLAHINQEGIGRASQRAFRAAIKNLDPQPDFHLVDAFFIKNLPKSRQLAIVRGDQKSASIAAASILAKVYRDQLMQTLSLNHPAYGFDQHKGYGTKLHQEAIRSHGFTHLHRTSFNISYLLEASQ